MATTEHFNLQTARAGTISEADGRASIYIAAVSSNLIALALTGQISRLGAAFYAFSLILLPVLAFVGFVTFQRLVQSSMEDVAYAQRIARLRNPRAGAVLGRLVEATPGEPLNGGLFAPGEWQVTRTTAGMVAVVNSAVIGVSAGLALAALPGVSLAVTLTAGAAVGASALWVHCSHQRRAGDAYELEGIDRYATLATEPQATRRATRGS